MQNLLCDKDLLAAITVGLGCERHTDRVTNAFGQENRERRTAGHDAFGAHARFGEPEMERIVASCRKTSITFHEVRHDGNFCTDNDLVVREPHLFGQCRRTERALQHGVHVDILRITRRVGAGVSVHHLREQVLVERAPVHADAHRLVVIDRRLHDGREVCIAALGADVPGIDAILVQRCRARRVFGQQ